MNQESRPEPQWGGIMAAKLYAAPTELTPAMARRGGYKDIAPTELVGAGPFEGAKPCYRFRGFRSESVQAEARDGQNRPAAGPRRDRYDFMAISRIQEAAALMEALGQFTIITFVRNGTEAQHPVCD